jgi:hypothetical protein
MQENARFFTSSFFTKIARPYLWAWIFAIFTYNCLAVDDDDRRPNEHFCPITLQVMKDPVVAADGHSYERSAISEYFQSRMGSRSPITGLSLANQNLFDNQALKAMIVDWKPGRQGEPSVLETRDAASIAERVREEFQRNAALLDSSKGKDIVAFLGNTGAGKSTLVNFLTGKELVVGPYGEDYVLAHPEDKTAMVIGAGGNSETLYPKFIDVGDLRFFDLPGFNDTDGSERNLVNAAFIRKILLDAASVRLVIVAGQDQFTADRSASVKQLFDCVKQLFVANQDNVLVDNGVFVATKITCDPQVEITDFLLRRTDSKDKAALNQQLKLWSDRNQLGRMFHPLREVQNRDVREHILARIKDTKPAKVLGINVSVLYPPDTKEPLERMFLSVFEDAFNRNLKSSLESLSDQECYNYDKAIVSYGSETFWSTFEANVRAQDNAIELLKEFCLNPYHKALKRFEEGNEGKRQQHIKILEDNRKKRIKDIERTFFDFLNGVFDRNLHASLTTLSDYNEAIASYGSDTFWPTFGTTVSNQEDMIGLLKKFCRDHYDKALRSLEEENEGKRQEHIKNLEHRRKGRIEDIERRTERRTKEVISSLVPKKEGNEFVFFDFAYHRDIHDQVCGSGSIHQLATDVQEQDVVRSHYAGLISQHSHDQMMRWHEKFSGVEDLKKQLESTQKKLDGLVEGSLIKLCEVQEAAQEAERNIEALSKQLEESEETVAAKTKETQVLKSDLEQSQIAEQHASERICDVSNRLEQHQRESSQQIENLVGQLTTAHNYIGRVRAWQSNGVTANLSYVSYGKWCSPCGGYRDSGKCCCGERAAAILSRHLQAFPS